MAQYQNIAQLHLPTIEKNIAQWWQQTSMFQQSITARNGMPAYVFYEGPPSANGMPGIHHVISRTIKDLFCRYKTMQGYQVSRKAGWDTHGLPVELGVEKELGITKEDIGKKISVEEYNAQCRTVVMRYQDLWSSITEKMGYWVDLSQPYVTYHNSYVETLWWCIKELHTKNLLYKSVSIQPYSPAAGTGLSSHELNQPGCQRPVKDTSATVLFQLNTTTTHAAHASLANMLGEQALQHTYFMAWTTTPWTLPSNLGLTVGAHIEYVVISTINPYTHAAQNVILAQPLVSKYFDSAAQNAPLQAPANSKDPIPWQQVGTLKGAQLEGLRYYQLLPFDVNNPALSGGDSLRVICGDFVTTEDGTGIVHTAPAFGADDYKVGQKNNLGIINLVDRRGRFVAGVSDGLYIHEEEHVKEEYLTDAEKVTAFAQHKNSLEAAGKIKDLKKYLGVNDRIVLKLQDAGMLWKKEKYEHNYPHCWRTDKPIIYYPLDAWFVKTSAVRERMMALNNTINWKPKATGEGRFGNWLENMVDWNLSRSRFWGTPLPIWRSQDATQEICIGSTAQLIAAVQDANVQMNAQVQQGHEQLQAYIQKNETYLAAHSRDEHDLHKPYIDDVYLWGSAGLMQREPDLIDVWFDSGAMPYAQWGIPFAEKLKAGDAEAWQKFPADFIAEGVDQTRGWFYTLHALAAMLFDNVAYKNVISNGLVLDKDGQKMSKRLGNVVDPFTTIDQYGADATRWYLVTNASPWDSVKFNPAGIEEAQRKFFGTLYNTYSFFALYANVDKFTYTEQAIAVSQRPELDRWVISKLHNLIQDVSNSYDEYEPTRAARAIQEFVDEHLSNWHVRLSRKRFWRGEYEHDKICAYQTLYECLIAVAQLMAPVAPFFAEWLYRNMNTVSNKNAAESVHISFFPKCNEALLEPVLESQMYLAQEVCSLVLSLRKKEKIKVRQPLLRIMIPVLNNEMQKNLQHVEPLIFAETNIKSIEYLHATENKINKTIKANFKLLGAKLGANMKSASQAIAAFSQSQINEIESKGEIEIDIDGTATCIFLEEVEIQATTIPGWSVASSKGITVALDITITPQLEQEGLARELINRVQNLRKESGLEVTDRIVLNVLETHQLRAAVEEFSAYIRAEILADGITFFPALENGVGVEINELQTKIEIVKQ